MPSSMFVVDSSPAVRRLVEQISTPEGFDVVGFHDGPAALEAAKQFNPVIIVVDYHLDNMTFSGFCKEIHKLDHLAETHLVSLINPADHPDEGHLRSLGVKAFLSKPFQPDNLIEIIKSLPQKQQTPNSIGFKQRTWPPAATSTDSDGDGESPNHVIIASNNRPDGHAIDRQAPSPRPASAASPASAGPQDAMKGLFDQLLLSVAKESEKRLAELLPRTIEEKLASHLRLLIPKEVRSQLGDTLSAEQLAAIIRPLLSRELPSLLGKEIANSEPIIRQTVSNAVETLVKEKIDQWAREQVQAGIREYLPDLIREQIGSIDQMVKAEMRTAVAQQAPLLADDIVRTIAEPAVEQSVQHVVPKLAEQHVKAELKRLTASS